MDDTIARQYGASIALVSGLYSLTTVAGGSGMLSTGGGLLMALLGVVVVVHGVALLTPYAERLGAASGPLMIGYAVLMLLNQALVGATGSLNWGMDGAMGPGMPGGDMMGSASMGSGLTAGMGWDLGMLALAVLMLVSGVIMTNRGSAGGTGSRM